MPVNMPNKRRPACDSCHRRKIQCDVSVSSTQCDWCMHHNLPCLYERARGRRKKNGPASSGTTSAEQSPLRRSVLLKGDSQTLSPSSFQPRSITQLGAQPPPRVFPACSVCRSQPPSSTAGKQANIAPLGQIYFAGQRFGALCPRNGMPHFNSSCEQWVYERTGDWPRFGTMYNEAAPAHDQQEEPVSTQTLTSLMQKQTITPRIPNKETLQSLARDFFKSDYCLVFPVINEVLFERTIQLAYSNDRRVPECDRLIAKASVLAFASLAKTHFPNPATDPIVDDDICGREAQLLLSTFMENTSVTALQTMVIMIMRETLCGRLHSSTVYHAMACRTIFALGGHTQTGERFHDGEPSLLEQEDEHLRNLFWICYAIDKDMALRTGQPIMMLDQYCDLTLPEGYVENKYSCQPSKRQGDQPRKPWFAGDLRLSIIKSRALRLLYSNAVQTNAEILKSIRELDEELETWRLSIPLEFSPTLLIPRDITLAEQTDTAKCMLLIETHMDYHYLLNTIHSVSGRCLLRESSPQGQTFLGLESSFDLSIEASRSTLIYLAAAAGRLTAEAFMYFAFYPFSALMVMFFNILEHPSHSLAIQDLEMLAQTGAIIRSMPCRKLLPSEVEYLARMDKLIAELHRLGTMAIQRQQHLIPDIPTIT